MIDTILLEPLNEKQREVVSAPPRHLAVIAGAGSGKTRVLVHRIAWLIKHEHISPNSILAVTYTNKAAAQMRERIEQLTHLSTRSMWVGTFHRIAHWLLRFHWQQAGLPETFQIIDADDQLRLIRKVHASLNLDNNKWPLTQSQWYINHKKDEGLRPHKIFANNYSENTLIEIYNVYEQQCAQSGLVDFAELLLRSYELLSQHDDLILHYQQRFVHILVDEFQDTNTIQYDLLKLLAGKTSIMMIVGDDDQSIYSWRGAQIKNIFSFNQDFPGKIIRLEQNYRSTKNILAAARAVIAHNDNRFDKDLWTEIHEGDPISLYTAFNEIDEAKYIINEIKNWAKQGMRCRDIAILYRSNAQSRIFEEELLGANIPYHIYGGQKFFERAEVKDAMAYFRLMVNPHDDSAFERAVNTPARGIGNTTLAALREYALTSAISLWQASEDMLKNSILTARAKTAINSFLQLILNLSEEILSLPLSLQAKTIIEKSGLYAHYSKDRSDKIQSRLENLQELIQATVRFKNDENMHLSPLHSFVCYVALESGDTQAEISVDSVHLMTLHSAKGLEFMVVFLAGMEEGLFPHKMSMKEPGRLEEERRLCYVGMTRARKKLYLCYAESRRINGTQSYNRASRFISEIPKSLLQEIRLQTKILRSTPAAPPLAISHDFGLGFKLGDRVSHHTYGEGIILNYEGKGPNTRIQVKFYTEGIKWLIAEVAKLEKVL